MMDRAASIIDAPYVGRRLAEAGATLLCLPSPARPGLKPDDVIDAGHKAFEALRSARVTPEPAAIDRMDETLGWLGLIRAERIVLRRILAARSLTNPITGRPLYSWRRIARAVGADHKAIQRWHEQGLTIIANELNHAASASERARIAADMKRAASAGAWI